MRIVFTMLAVFAALSAGAQGYAELIKANPAMAAANLMNYHFEELVDQYYNLIKRCIEKE